MFANEGLSKHENWGKQPETKKSGVRKNNQGWGVGSCWKYMTKQIEAILMIREKNYSYKKVAKT